MDKLIIEYLYKHLVDVLQFLKHFQLSSTYFTMKLGTTAISTIFRNINCSTRNLFQSVFILRVMLNWLTV